MTTLLRPWSAPGRLWREICHVALGLVTGTMTFTVTVVAVATAGSLLLALPLALPVAWLMFLSTHLLASVERSRIASLLDLELADPVDPLRTSGWFRRLWERTTSWPRWKEMIHHVVALPLGLLAFALVFGAWCGSIALVGLPVYVDSLPDGSAKFWLFDVGRGTGAAVLSVCGLLGLVFVAPWVTRVVAVVHRRWATLMLGPRRDSLLVETVSRLETSRSAAVDSAEAERRRIERDLHDGAQQRLVALAASLGEARLKLEDGDGDAGQRLVAGAHEEAKAALKEIRDLVRGIHPVILEDRGLDAALSAVVARAPIPVSLTVEVGKRP